MWGRGSERPAAHTQQKLTQVPLPPDSFAAVLFPRCQEFFKLFFSFKADNTPWVDSFARYAYTCRICLLNSNRQILQLYAYVANESTSCLPPKTWYIRIFVWGGSALRSNPLTLLYHRHFSQNGYLFSILLWEVLLGDIGFYGYLTLRYDTLIWHFISQLFVCFPWNKLNFGVDRALLWTRKSRISWDREMSSWSNSYSLAKTPSG